MNNTISVFLPVRAGSERIKNKNTRTFAGIEGGLLKIKLAQLLECHDVDQIILSTNDINSMKIANQFESNKLKIIKRPEHLALSTTDLKKLVDYVPKICKTEHILWTHVTSPMVKSKDYSNAIHIYFENLKKGFDSLMSVKEIQNFIWSRESNKVVNKKKGDTTKWPRTQDLDKVYEINSAIFIASRELYMKEQDRVGRKPYLYTQDDMKSTDVDWYEDFKLAEILYKSYE